VQAYPDVFPVLGKAVAEHGLFWGSVLAFNASLPVIHFFQGAMTRTEERRRESSMVQSISNFFSMVLNWLYSVVPNYPVDIILMTILLKLILEPLTYQQLRTSFVISRIQGELQEIAKKYKMIHSKRLRSSLRFTRNMV